MEGEGEKTDLEHRLDGIWTRSRPAVIERIEVIERVAAADSPAADDQAAARADAHKLRGLLGTLGLARGSELAAEIEDELERAIEVRPEPGWQQRVATHAAELRADVEAR